MFELDPEYCTWPRNDPVMTLYLGFFREMIIEPILTRNALPSFIQAYENNDSNLMKELFYSVSIRRNH